MNRLFSPEPSINLVKAFSSPFRNVVATAKTCYSSKGIIEDEQVGRELERIAQSIYQAGHHTTFQHAHFQFAITNVSRQFIWSFLHSHPFYNSEQVSQRYVPVKSGSFAIPPLTGEARKLFVSTAENQLRDYQNLLRILEGPTADEYNRLFRRTPKIEKRLDRTVIKKSQEIARYVLPIATLAYLYHTVSGITLLRYYRLCQQEDAPLEQRIVVDKMVEALLEFDPLYRTVLQEPLDINATPEAQFFSSIEKGSGSISSEFIEEFDENLDGRVSKLISYKPENQELLAQAVREVLGRPRRTLSDEQAIQLVLDPSRNRLLGESLNLTTHSKLSRTLFHPNYTFRKKMSHTADSQDQRHRMTPASRPCISVHLTEEPDYIEPEILKHSPQAQSIYRDSMEQSWTAIARLRSLGVPDEFALYLLPNAVAIRFTESADLLNLHHKHVMRLCYNAQEEIWRASRDEAAQIRDVNPLIGNYLLPPCTIRNMAKMRPKCPEGDRFCGVRVWQLDLDEYVRII